MQLCTKLLSSTVLAAAMVLAVPTASAQDIGALEKRVKALEKAGGGQHVSRTKKTTARAVDTTPGSPPVAGVPKTGVQTPATRKFPARLSDKSRRATLKKSKSAAHKRLKKPPLISPKREAPLQREIARSPSDPFASIVAAVILHASLLLVIYPLLFPPPEQLPPPKTSPYRTCPSINAFRCR